MPVCVQSLRTVPRRGSSRGVAFVSEGGMHLRQKPRNVVFMASIVLVANVCTYFLLCRPDVELPHADPAGFRYMQHVLRSGGGFLAPSPIQRCGVHCGLTTLRLLFSVILRGGAARLSS